MGLAIRTLLLPASIVALLAIGVACSDSDDSAGRTVELEVDRDWDYETPEENARTVAAEECSEAGVGTVNVTVKTYNFRFPEKDPTSYTSDFNCDDLR